MSNAGKRIVLARYPEGMPGHDDLKLEKMTIPRAADGEVLLRTIYLSLDPYMRGRMSPQKSYAASTGIGETVTAEAACEVIESRHPDFAQGDFVVARTGWQTHAAMAGSECRTLDPALAPLSTSLGVLGMPGFTAYVGLLEHGRPQKGETVVVSAAAGAVGQLVGQIAKVRGARAIGIAGADDKCRMVTDDFGFDACINYKDADFSEQLAAACPDGIDVYFENVGGAVFKAVLPLLNDFARIPVCGLIAHYNDTAPPEGPDSLPGFMRMVLVKRLSVRGFINYDHIEHWADFEREMSSWLTSGAVKYREDFVDGIENAVDAFQGLLTGRNRGKLVIRVGEDPTL